MSTLTIPPTIGRRVLVFVAGTAGVNDPGVPFDCGIAFVWDQRPGQLESTINVGGVNHAGQPVGFTSVRLYDRAQNDADAHGGNEVYAVWMPYQFEQAQKHAQKA